MWLDSQMPSTPCSCGGRRGEAGAAGGMIALDCSKRCRAQRRRGPPPAEKCAEPPRAHLLAGCAAVHPRRADVVSHRPDLAGALALEHHLQQCRVCVAAEGSEGSRWGEAPGCVCRAGAAPRVAGGRPPPRRCQHRGGILSAVQRRAGLAGDAPLVGSGQTLRPDERWACRTAQRALHPTRDVAVLPLTGRPGPRAGHRERRRRICAAASGPAAGAGPEGRRSRWKSLSYPFQRSKPRWRCGPGMRQEGANPLFGRLRGQERPALSQSRCWYAFLRPGGALGSQACRSGAPGCPRHRAWRASFSSSYIHTHATRTRLHINE